MTASAETRHSSMVRRMRRARARGEGRVGSIVILVLVTIAVLTPFAWVVSLSFTPQTDAFGSVSLIPANPTLENYSTAFIDADLDRSLLNSAVVGLVTVATNCIFAVLAGYAFAMLPFPGNRALFYTLISTAAIPISVTLIPLFLMARGIPLVGGNDILGQGGSGLLDTLAGVILPYIVMPMNIFLARQFFSSAPLELGEAARMDGASELRIFAGVYLPLAKPLVAVVAIFSFTGVWDDFLWPLVVTSSQEVQTVQLALARFLGSGNVQYGPLMAGTVIATIPVLIVFLLNQRSFISGLSDGGVKG
jgi:multiple sugar transport system permease protein